ncbi:R2-like ligand-binding oxidase [Gemmatimonas sp.]|jgi:ribonucleoside-diphosphate reductase beta chain|uniref:R2-like ligand-binding oxidase n=1 Tax=Gemmatimonas sp. TaxID=1962908 RepID=UPI0037C0D0BC
MHPLFSHEWALALGAALESSAMYREAARRWDGAVCLQRTADADHGHPAAAVFLDLKHGRCHAARLATEADLRQARFVISGPLTAWLTVLRGDEAPTVALMRGHLMLSKGMLPMLLPHVGAANALVDVARAVSPSADDRAPAVPTTPDHTAVPAGMSAPRPGFRSLERGALTDESVPWRLWEKAKRHGIWNPADIDFTVDAEHWRALAPDEQDLLLRLATLFQGGEEAVVIDILPLLDVVSQERRLDEQLYLTSFVWEEAKHVEGMHRFLHAVGALDTDLTRFHTPAYHTIFTDALPQAMQRLRHDTSPVAQARASATYNMIVEGVLAETGYHVFHEILVSRDILPGMQQMTGLLKLDESRHIAYGLYLLSRLGIEHGAPVWDAIADTMNVLMDPAIAVITEAFAAYPADAVPFALSSAPFVEHAMSQGAKRLDRLERARAQGVPVGTKE